MPSNKDAAYRKARAEYLEAGNDLYEAKNPKVRMAARKKYAIAKKRYHTEGNKLWNVK